MDDEDRVRIDGDWQFGQRTGRGGVVVDAKGRSGNAGGVRAIGEDECGRQFFQELRHSRSGRLEVERSVAVPAIEDRGKRHDALHRLRQIDSNRLMAGHGFGGDAGCETAGAVAQFSKRYDPVTVRYSRSVRKAGRRGFQVFEGVD